MHVGPKRREHQQAPGLGLDVDALVVELAFERHYAGQPLFTEVLDHLGDRGFVLDVPIDVRRDEAGTVVEMDGLFLPAP